MKISIRRAHLSDINDVYRFMCSLEETEFDPKDFYFIFKNNLRCKNIHYFVACTNRLVIGFISLYSHPFLHHCSNVGEIAELFVKDDFRRKKVGSILVKAAIKKAKELKCTTVEVHSNIRRKKAHHFYIKENFKKTHYKFIRELNDFP